MKKFEKVTTRKHRRRRREQERQEENKAVSALWYKPRKAKDPDAIIESW